MPPAGVVLPTVIQLGVFLTPLGLARQGFISGEVAFLTAIVGWFAIGMPLSYSATDHVRHWTASRAARPQSVSAPRSAFSFSPPKAFAAEIAEHAELP